MAVRLWGGAPSFALTGLHGNAQTLGMAFSSSEDRTCTGFHIYRLSGMVSGQMPTRARCWRDTDGHVMGDLAISPATGANGWLDFSWPAPFTLAAGVHYRLGVDYPGGYSYPASDPTSIAPSPDAPLALVGGGKCLQEPVGYPDSGSSLYFGIDVIVEGDALSGGGGTAGTGGTATTGDLSAWLSATPTVNTHQSDGLPWQDHTALTALTSLLGARGGSLAALSLWEALAYLASHIQDVKNAVDSGRAVIDTIRTWFSGAKPAEQDPIDTILNRIDLRSEGAYGASNALRGLPIFPSTGWSLQDVASFDNDIAWDVPADLYVLVADPVTPERPVTSVDGAPWRPRLGWWAVRNGDFFEGRQYIDFDHAHLINGGRRMPGVVIRLEQPSSGTLEAWTYALP